MNVTGSFLLLIYIEFDKLPSLTLPGVVNLESKMPLDGSILSVVGTEYAPGPGIYNNTPHYALQMLGAVVCQFAFHSWSFRI